MTVPTSSGRDDATLRGAVVLVVAIVIGLALLARGGSGDDEAATTTTEARGAAQDDTTFDGSQSTLPPIDSSSTDVPSGTHTPADVTAIVLNGITERVDNAASDNSAKLATAGFTMLEPSPANAKIPATTIYSAPEFAADADAVRTALGLPDAALAEKPAETLGAGAERADIVVVLGDDYAS